MSIHPQPKAQGSILEAACASTGSARTVIPSGVRFDRRREKRGKGRTSMLPAYQPALFPVPSSSRRQTPFVLSPSKDERGER
jgi:hypothetical protein